MNVFTKKVEVLMCYCFPSMGNSKAGLVVPHHSFGTTTTMATILGPVDSYVLTTGHRKTRKQAYFHNFVKSYLIHINI